MPFGRLAPATAIALTAIAAGAVSADTYLPPDDAAPPRPAHHHGHVVEVSHVALQDEVVITAGPLRGVHARVLAVQHKFFDAEPWVELLAMQPDHNGHLHWMLVPACGLERVPGS